LRETYAKIRELERALDRKTMDVEMLRTAQEIVNDGAELRGEHSNAVVDPSLQGAEWLLCDASAVIFPGCRAAMTGRRIDSMRA